MKDVGYLNSLPAEDFLHRRENLIAKLPQDSLTIIFSSQEHTRNKDCEYKFRQDSYFWYLTGFNEPDSILLIYKTLNAVKTYMYLRPRDPLMETWNGKRLGLDNAQKKFNLTKTYDIKDFSGEITKFIAQNSIKQLICDTEVQPWSKTYLENILPNFPEQISFTPLLDEMRLIKSANEIKLMQRAGEISAYGHIRAMKTCRPKRYEYELEHEIIYEFSRHGALFCSYNSIVASGNNANTLHYEENSDLLEDGDLVLIDAGCEYDYYAGDITRTFPINGKFSPAQQEIYSLVLHAQKTAIKMLIPGNTLQAASDKVIEIFIDGLLKLHILTGTKEEILKNQTYRKFYMHSLGHWLGLDVHDVGAYRVDKARILEPGMVVTVEPGIYIDKNLDVPDKYKGIGIRIEDDILLTEHGNKVLTAAVPKEIKDIEELMSSK